MSYKINLLPRKKESIVDKLIYFAFHYLRYILVITQLVVIGVFFYRLRVDQDIIELRDNIKQKQEIIRTVRPLLEKIEEINRKSADIKPIINRQDSTLALYKYFFTKLPSDINLSTININVDSLTCDGMTQSISSVKMFYDELLVEKRFKKVELMNVKKQLAGYSFTLTLTGFK